MLPAGNAGVFSVEVREVVNQAVVGIRTVLVAEVLRFVCRVIDVGAELEGVSTLQPGDRVGILLYVFVGILWPLQEIRGSKVKTDRGAGQLDERRQAQGVGISRRIYQRVLLVRRGSLVVLVFKVAPILEAELVGDVRRDERVQVGDTPGVLHIIVAKAGNAVVVAGLRLDAGRRSPSHAVDRQRKVVLLVDVPVDLRKPDVLLARAGHGAQHAIQAIQSIRVVGLRLGTTHAEPGCETPDGCGRGCSVECGSTEGDGRTGEIPVVPVVSEVPKYLVLDDGPAETNTADSANIRRLEGLDRIHSRRRLGRERGEWIRRTPRVVSVEEVSLAVDFVGAALRHRINDATGSAPVLSGIVRGVDLELLHRNFGS